ncbi:PTS system IIA component, fructose subfamily [Treponema primitia ZAS-2]|uniref:PTS system IIA component, fructose subfamily n=1 Tax=Treponema primitia (strain ATCC BAA-887 / DSM 12427 / ZAS-2) TaxID=545694 RepID=F5YI41_TREPZ|nr:PTS sugar transporter subunit IIA [Treponema primitia]AEF85051.1 PTS system IIA component, fructose subfamily [Treponema primitia ZAS-2]
MIETTEEPGLSALIKRGGGFSPVPGSNPQELLTNLIRGLTLPRSVDAPTLLEAVLEREALMPTAIGHGIALPHPRNPLISVPGEQFVTIAYTGQDLDWNALDGKPVHTVILMVSASAKLHLHTLSRINFFCHQESFRELLTNRVSRDDFIRAIEEAEQGWG